ncbi:MAG TPA: hypothetical protein VLL75_07775 [Vicinamibacteria bacterium]|nr:hypothetical protein [Vicinamibacteria bacterium]
MVRTQIQLTEDQFAALRERAARSLAAARRLPGQGPPVTACMRRQEIVRAFHFDRHLAEQGFRSVP